MFSSSFHARLHSSELEHRQKMMIHALVHFVKRKNIASIRQDAQDTQPQIANKNKL